MALDLRKVIHPQTHDNYCVILKSEDGEFDRLNGIQHSAGAVYVWVWGIDTGIPMRAFETQGKARTARTA